MLCYLDPEPSAAEGGGLQLINILRKSPELYSSFFPGFIQISILAQTISVIYYARIECNKDEFLKKKLMTSDSLKLLGTLPEVCWCWKFPYDLMTFDLHSKTEGIQETDWKILSNF